MMHTKLFEIYAILLRYVSFAKELEFQLKIKFRCTEESIFKDFTAKNIPQSGAFDFKDNLYSWRFHGSGITFTSNEFRFHYTAYSGGLSVTIHSGALLGYCKHFNLEVPFGPKELDDIFEMFADLKLLEKIFVDGKIFVLI